MLYSFFMLIAISYLMCWSSSATLPNTRNYPYSSTIKLSLADSAESTEYHIREPEGPGTYSFGFDIEDSQTGNVQFRTEERHSNGTVQGSYGYLTPEKTVLIVHYVADYLGYRTKIEESRRIKSPNKNYNSVETFQDNISPQMKAALQSLENQNILFDKKDQRVRPIDKINSRSSNLVNVLNWSVQEKKN